MSLADEQRSEHPGYVIVHNVGRLAPDERRQVAVLGVCVGVVADCALPVVAPEGWEAGSQIRKELEDLRVI